MKAHLINQFLHLRLYFMWLFCICGITFLSGQNAIQINVMVNPPYPPILHEYTKLGNKVITTLVNNTDLTKQVYLHGLFTNDDNFTAQTREQYIPAEPIILQPHSVYQIEGNEQGYAFFNDQNVEVNYGHNILQEFIEGGFLPAGNYRLCITAYDYQTHEKISDTELGCSMFRIENLNAPILISPQCTEDFIVPKLSPQNIDFSWTPVINGDPNVQIRYNLYLAPITENDNPQDVIETGINTNGVNIIKIPDIQINHFNYGMNNYILLEGRYAWAVKAYVVNNIYPIENNGLSNVCTFNYTNINQQNEDAGADVQWADNIDCSCKTEPISNTISVPQSELAVIHQVHTGAHILNIVSLTYTEGLFSGTGTINLPVLNNDLVKVKVAFSNIGIEKKDGVYFHTSGNILAMQSNEAASLMPTYDPINPGQLSFSPAQTENLGNYFEQYAQQLLSEIKKAPNTVGYKLPIGLDEGAIKIAILSMVFTPKQSYFDAAAVLDVFDGNTKVALAGVGICMTAGDLCGQAKLYLAEDFNISAIGIKLNGGISDQSTSILFDKDGFKKLHIGATYTFPAGTLVKYGTDTPANVVLTADTDKGWSDWIAECSFTAFNVSGFTDFVFGPDDQNSKIYYDHSDTRNPDNIPSPYRSTDPDDSPIHTELLTWRGFYIPSINLKLPAAFNNINNTPITVNAQKLIFDEGLSGSISVNNILAISDGSLDGWYFSIDAFNINFWKNSFKNSQLKGKIVLPLSKKPDVSNQLDYTCTLSKPANSNLEFAFIIKPKDGVSFDALWAKTHFAGGNNVSEGSIIEISKKNNEGFKAAATLNGTMDIVAKIDPIPDINLAAIKFQNFKIHSEAPYILPGETQAVFFGLASPQHSIAGFVIDLNPEKGRGISFDLADGNINLRFKALLKLVADADFVPRADIEFKVYGKIKYNGIRPDWDGIGAGIDKISLGADASIGSVKVRGDIAYFNKNGSYGFMGNLNMEISDLFGISAKAVFGYQKQGDFNFFFIDGMVDLGTNGFPIPPCMAIYGFKGGVYYNMAMPDSSTLSGNNIQTNNYDPDQDPMTSLSGVRYLPFKGRFAVNAGILFGFKQRNLLDADGSLSISFNTRTGGVSYVYLRLTGRVITDYTDPISKKNADCMGYAIIQMKMNFDEKSFLFNALLEFGAPNHSEKTIFFASAQVNFFAGPTGWFIHFGRPWQTGNPDNAPNAINISIFNSLKFKAYFQCGNGTGKILAQDGSEQLANSVDPMPPIPDYIQNILFKSRGGVKGENGSANSLTEINYNKAMVPDGGIAFGANLSAAFDQTFLIFYIKANFMVGFDLAFYKLKNPVYCEDKGELKPFGSNGYYAKGQAYLGASIDLGIDIDLLFFSGRVSIVNAGVAATVEFGAPNPTFFKGAVGGYFSVLGGLISGGFSFDFYWGDECNLHVDEKIPLISDVFPKADYEIDQNTKLVTTKRATIKETQPIYTTPSVTFNYMVNRIFLIVHNEAGEDKKKYYYYRIDPNDVTINVDGGLSKIQEGSNTSQNIRSIDIHGFNLSQDNYSLIMDDKYLMKADQDFLMDVEAKVKIIKIENTWLLDRINGYSQGSGYKNNVEIPYGMPAWSYAKNTNGKVFMDFRYLKFKTDCGIKYLDESIVSNATPTHKSQNNPLAKSPPFLNSRLRQDSYNSATKIPMFAKITNPETYDISMEVKKAYLNTDMLCLPPEMKKAKLVFRINTFKKGGYNGYTFNTSYVDANILNSNRVAAAKLNNLLPENSFVVIQLIYQLPKEESDQNSSGSTFQKSSEIKTNNMQVLYINNRNLSLSAKLAAKKNEYQLFQWYFNTGSYNTYQDKMADLDIKMDTSIQQTSVLKSGKAQITELKLRSKITTYTFRGKEKFDQHDVRSYSLRESFPNASEDKYFDAKVSSGMLGMAFDKQSQGMIDSFLNTYFSSDMKNYQGLFSELIHQDMASETGWNVVYKNAQNILPFMDDLPLSLAVKMVEDPNIKPSNKYNPSVMPKKDFLTQSMQFDLFSIQKTSVIYNVTKMSDHIIPSVILNMDDVFSYRPGVSFINDLNRFANLIGQYNHTLKPKIQDGFQPGFLNQLRN